LFADETGSSKNMKNDKPGNKIVIAETGYGGTKEAITSDLRHTTIGFTAATGEPVMCCVIFTSKSKSGIPMNWHTGINITKVDSLFVMPESEGEMINTLTQTGAVSDGPTCKFNEIEVPCLIQYSAHGGVTPTILRNCFHQMDLLNLFPRVNGMKPILIVDGHDSRFDIKFLKYIRDSNHTWSVVIVLPYGTHLWQVGDSQVQNGNYKYFEREYKDMLVVGGKNREIWHLP
jgi:hypothetical protein